MTHYAPEIAASNVVEIRQACPVTTQRQPGRPSHQATDGESPLNPLQFVSPSPRDRRDALLTVFWSLVFAVPLAGVTVAIHLFR